MRSNVDAIDIALIVRDRETYRHLDIEKIHAYVEKSGHPLPAARPCRDSALVAFAQLSLLRLHAQRAFVCLLDRNYSYTIAEATATSTLKSWNATQQDLVACGTATIHSLSLPSALLKAAAESCHSGDGPMLSDLPVLTIPDLHADERFSSLSVVAADTKSKFCAAVPIKSSNGAIIGIFYILAGEDRDGLEPVSMDSLRDTSTTITDHLDLHRWKREFDRGTRMVRGLGSFVEDKSTMSGLSADALRGSSEEQRGREGALNVQQQDAQQKSEAADTFNHASANHIREPYGSEGPLLNHRSSRAPLPPTQDVCSVEHEPEPEDTSQPAHALSRATSTESLAASIKQNSETTSSFSTNEILMRTGANNTTRSNSKPPVGSIRELFSRAANIIREAIEVEGVLFFDASVGYWGGSLEAGKRDRSESASSTTSTSSSSSFEDGGTEHTISTERDETTCDVFGFSVTGGSSIDGKAVAADHLTVPERFLRILLRRYPRGKIFNFTSDGKHLSDTEVSEVGSIASHPTQDPPTRIRPRKRQNSYSRANEADIIVRIFPGARSLVAFPLWDSHRERWFAGGVAWTRTPTRIFSIQGELSYLRAFGIVVMAEAARIDARTATESKTILLNSISHELRSPLHGILGGVEILKSTELDVFQSNVIYTLDTCGIMLLDTIEHLLMQSNMNQSLEKAKLQRRKQRAVSTSSDSMDPKEMKSTPPTTEVDAVVEEVVESIYAGFEFLHPTHPLANSLVQDTQASDLVPSATQLKHDVKPSVGLNAVKVELNIKPATNWRFAIEPGALRRIVMNIFGNALKYTMAGSIKVTVSQHEPYKRKGGPFVRKGEPVSDVKVTVEDTGRGIGPEYLENHLFKPFTQENALNQGSGLGLSITHQIVASLNGKIHVKSTIGQGTTLTVYLRLNRSTIDQELQPDATFATQKKQLQDLRVSLFEFSEDIDMASGGTRGGNPQWQLPRASIEALCRDWLHMDVLAASEASIQPDLYITTEAGGRTLAALNHAHTVVQPVVVICPSAKVARDLTNASKTSDEFGVFEFVSQPCGPRKLAKTLALCLDRWAAIQVERAIRDDASPEPVVSPSDGTNTPPQVSSTSLAVPSGSHNRSDMKSLPLLLSGQPGAEASPSSTSPNPSKPSPTHNMTPCLIVDDNIVNVKVLSSYLSRKSVPYITAADGIDAVDAYKAARGQISCIFMDIQMPRMDGITATRAIREYEREERLEAVFVVALTGLVTVEKQREAEASGVDAFFAKPVRLKRLDAILMRTAQGERQS